MRSFDTDPPVTVNGVRGQRVHRRSLEQTARHCQSKHTGAVSLMVTCLRWTHKPQSGLELIP